MSFNEFLSGVNVAPTSGTGSFNNINFNNNNNNGNSTTPLQGTTFQGVDLMNFNGGITNDTTFTTTTTEFKNEDLNTKHSNILITPNTNLTTTTIHEHVSNIKHTQNNDNLSIISPSTQRSKQNYLVVLPSVTFEPNFGISARHLKDIIDFMGRVGATLTFVTPKGDAPAPFLDSGDLESWVKEYEQQFFSTIHSISEFISSPNSHFGFMGIIYPSCTASYFELSSDHSALQLLNQFLTSQKPICAIGYGVSALCNLSNISNNSAIIPSKKWIFSSYTLTSITNLEAATYRNFHRLPFSTEDFIREHGGSFSRSSQVGSVYVCIDRKLITAQNENSTELALRNLLFLSDN